MTDSKRPSRFAFYALYDLRVEPFSPRYVGQTKRVSLDVRLTEHIVHGRLPFVSKNIHPLNAKNRWVFETGRENVRIKELETTICYTEEALWLERRWIAKLRAEGHDILNDINFNPADYLRFPTYAWALGASMIK